MIAIVGELRTRTYDDRRYPDVKHYVTEVYADKASFCGSKNENSNPKPAAQTVSSSAYGVNDLSDFEEVHSDGRLPF